MNPESRAVAVDVLKAYFASLGLRSEDADAYTPNKVIRRYLKEKTLIRAPPKKSAERTVAFWIALFFGSALGRHAKHSVLYRDFINNVVARSGLTVSDNSRCSVMAYDANCLTEWQVMALFYMSGDPIDTIRAVVADMGIQLGPSSAKVLPLNMRAFCQRCAKMVPFDYDMHLGDMTLDADYAIISSISMADLMSDGVIVIGTSPSEKKRKEIIVSPSTRSRIDTVKWTAVETQLFELDDRWRRFKVAACLSPDHPPLWTIRVYLTNLPKPPVIIPHGQFVLDYMPYFDVTAVANLQEVREFAACLKARGEDVDKWPPAKLITRLVWLYDPYSTGAAITKELLQYVTKYPRLTTPFICGLVTT